MIQRPTICRAIDIARQIANDGGRKLMARSKPGKYDAVLPRLKPLPVEDLSYQEKVDAEKKRIQPRDPITVASLYERLRIEKHTLEKQMYDLNLLIAASEQLLVESQQNEEAGWGAYGVRANALRLANGTTIRIKPEPYGVVRDKEAFRQWCIANGYEKKLQLWPTAMNAIVKERLLHGEPEPDGTEAFQRKTVVYVPVGAKDQETVDDPFGEE